MTLLRTTAAFKVDNVSSKLVHIEHKPSDGDKGAASTYQRMYQPLPTEKCESQFVTMLSVNAKRPDSAGGIVRATSPVDQLTNTGFNSCLAVLDIGQLA